MIRRVVTATTTNVYMDNEVPKVEVHISPATETIISPPLSPHDEGPQLNSTHIEHIEVVATSASYRPQGDYDDDARSYTKGSFSYSMDFIYSLLQHILQQKEIYVFSSLVSLPKFEHFVGSIKTLTTISIANKCYLLSLSGYHWLLLVTVAILTSSPVL